MTSRDTSPDAASFDALKWRCIGPPRGGRVVAVAGDPVNRMVFYFGACAGGIWKTVDGGVFWRCVSDGFMGSAAVGSIAVAPSDPNVIYAGTGETAIRLDVSWGDGVYRSTDAGRTWTNVGLRGSKFVGRICIHPRDPDLVYVAALGDVFGPNEERGVYRSRDGGRTWERILYRSDVAGAIDLSMDLANPRILYASMWEARRNFWNISSGGPGSGLFRSDDGGDTWQEISRHAGLPEGMLGKIGVAVSPVRSGRVWALIEAEGDKTGLYRSDDHGARWTQVSANRDLMHRPWYYTHVFADTGHADTVYVTNLQMWKSTDGGASFAEVTTRHGDNHDLWIDPRDSTRMIEGNDGGANVSFNGGESWSTIYNQKTAQFYRIDIDDQYPYRVYGTQQDNTSISVPSASEWGVITLADCSYPGTGESGFIAVDPRDHNIVYVGAIGSSPGGAGALQRYDHRTRQIQLVNVWPEESTGIAPKDLKYRFAWTFPIVFSPHDPGTLYAGGNCVFRTRDEGMSWQRISPDLSLNDRTRQGHSGGPITRESAGAEVHATCACVVESPNRRDEIWASTDDGLVHVTRDGGESWKNVTPKAMPELAYVGCVEVSAHDPDTIYLAATRYKLGDYRPYLFRSSNGGRSWKAINGNLPADEITRVVRADPGAPGLLYVGTETGIHFSLDDGATWTRMGGGLPVVPVYDLKLKDCDLVAATHGRSFWILDDVTALRGLADGRRTTRLFAPRRTVRTKLHWSAGANVRTGIAYGPAFGIDGSTVMVDRPDGTRTREHLDVGENPPNGAIVHYWLAKEPEEPVVLTFREASGRKIASFASDDKALAPARRPGTRAGLNRFVWDMKYPGPTRIDYALAPPRPKPLVPDPENPPGPTVVPGSYGVELAAGGRVHSARFEVVKDPRLPASEADYAAQFALHKELVASLSRLKEALNRLRRARRGLAAIAGGTGKAGQALRRRAAAIDRKLAAIEGIMVDPQRKSVRDVLRNPAGLNDTLFDMISMTTTADAAPTSQTRAVSREVMDRVDREVARFEALVAGDIAELDAACAKAGVGRVATG
ncbi:WD40/YVTN/BNR-like repeat-containing protein [Reyranella sp.]|uniref:WD40/YVTN/BNR-like repeat-containing protein n=1 Tax=Reyranella sp. TaxID=1929291 RepID=UPI003BAA5AEB